MKLRVRAARGGAGTHRVEVSDYDELQNVLGGVIGVAPERLRFSLNMREWMEGGVPGVPLAEYGIRSGDLIYYTLDDAENSAAEAQAVTAMDVDAVRRERCATAADKRAGKIVAPDQGAEKGSETDETSMVVDSSVGAEAGSSSAGGAGAEASAGEGGGLELDENAVSYAGNQIPCLFSRILVSEQANISRPPDFLVIAVHGVMLETGFILLDSADNNRIPWDSIGSLKYTLPGLETHRELHVMIRCQIVGSHLVVYGSAAGSPQFHRLSLSVSEFLTRQQQGGETPDPLAVYKDTLALWKEVKDSLTLRLLKLFCEIAGLPLPACFQRLPTDLKMKILELISGEDLARLTCVCSELRFLASSEELWKAQFLKEFNLRAGQAEPWRWKEAFIREWYSRKRRQQAQQSAVSRRDAVIPHYFRRPPIGPPWGIIGGDYDIYPDFPLGGGGGVNPFPFGGNPRFRRPLNPGGAAPLISGTGTSSSLILGSDPDDDSSEFSFLGVPRPGR